MFKVLTVAGSDSSGGAGIEADIKTVSAHGGYALAALTALTAQNTKGVFGVLPIDPSFVKMQIDVSMQDIMPDAVKTGMLGDAELIKAVALALTENKAKNIVCDPVMVSTSGCALIPDSAKDALCEYLFPISSLITPNIPEAEALCGFKIEDKHDMIKAGLYLKEKYGADTLIKGGHSVSPASDIFVSSEDNSAFCGDMSYIISPSVYELKGNIIYTEKCRSDKSCEAAKASVSVYELKGNIINTENTHGTGCTLSSAIASNLAMGYNKLKAIERAKRYLENALRADPHLGSGKGPLNHVYNFSGI